MMSDASLSGSDWLEIAVANPAVFIACPIMCVGFMLLPIIYVLFTLMKQIYLSIFQYLLNCRFYFVRVVLCALNRPNFINIINVFKIKVG